jgi:hypothetical protein
MRLTLINNNSKIKKLNSFIRYMRQHEDEIDEDVHRKLSCLCNGHMWKQGEVVEILDEWCVRKRIGTAHYVWNVELIALLEYIDKEMKCVLNY